MATNQTKTTNDFPANRISLRYCYQSYSKAWGYVASVVNGPQDLVFRTTEEGAIAACQEYVARCYPDLLEMSRLSPMATNQHSYYEIIDAFLVEVERLGGTREGASDWLVEACNTGLDEGDDAESLAWLCVDDELSGLEYDDPRAAVLRSALQAARGAAGAVVTADPVQS